MDTSSFDKDKPPSQDGFAYRNLPDAWAQIFTEITFGLMRTIASVLIQHGSLPQSAIVLMLDAFDTSLGLLHICPSFTHCVGTMAALGDPEVVQGLIELALGSEPAASIASLKLLAKLVPDLTKLDRTLLTGPRALLMGASSIADDTVRVIERYLIPALDGLVARAVAQGPGYSAAVSSFLAILLRAARAPAMLFEVQRAFKSHGFKFEDGDTATIARFLEVLPTDPTLRVRKSMIKPSRRADAACSCRIYENDPQRSPVCHSCFPYGKRRLDGKYGSQTVFGLRVIDGNRQKNLPLLDAFETIQIWRQELTDGEAMDAASVERVFKDCVLALSSKTEFKDTFRAAPGIPRVIRDKIDRSGTRPDDIVIEESAILLGRLLENLQIRSGVVKK